LQLPSHSDRCFHPPVTLQLRLESDPLWMENEGLPVCHQKAYLRSSAQNGQLSRHIPAINYTQVSAFQI